MAGYSNGFNIDKVLSALLGRVGWKQPTLTGSMALDAANITATSGRYFQDFHGIVNPAVLLAAQENPAINVSQFNAYLQDLQKAVIMEALAGVFNRPEIIEGPTLMHERFHTGDYPQANQGNFVGVRLTPANDPAVAIKIDSVALYFDKVATFNLYLFHDAVKAPLKTISVTTEAGSQKVQRLDWVVSYMGEQKGGRYYLGYFQDDIATTDTHGINEMVQRFNPVYNFGLVHIESKKQTGLTDFYRGTVAYTMQTHGLNIQCSAFNDRTQQIVDNAHLFDELLGLQMAAKTIETIQNSMRSNGPERITKELTDKLYTDLNLAMPTDNTPYVAGIRNRIQREVKRLNKTFYPCGGAITIEHDTEKYTNGFPEVTSLGY